MSLMTEYPKFNRELGATLNGPYGQMTPYDTSKQNNNANHPLGSVAFLPSLSQGGTNDLPSTAGYGAGLWVKLVRYLDSAKPAVKTGPAVVYWADSTFTTVVGTYASGVVASKSVSVAGWLLPNAGSVSGYGAGSLITATLLDNSGAGSIVWIGLSGFIPSAFVGSVSAGQRLYASGDFAVTGVTADGASTYSDFDFAGTALAASSSSLANIIATCRIF